MKMKIDISQFKGLNFNFGPCQNVGLCDRATCRFQHVESPVKSPEPPVPQHHPTPTSWIAAEERENEEREKELQKRDSRQLFSKEIVDEIVVTINVEGEGKKIKGSD